MGKDNGNRPRQANGSGYLKHDPKRGRWRGAVAWLEPDGTIKRKAFSGPTRAIVKDRMDALRRELAAGRKPTKPQTVAAYLTGWLEAERGRVRPSTWRFREGHSRLYIIPAIGGTKLDALQPRDVEIMTSDMVGRGLAPRTAASTRTTLRKSLGDALRDGLVHRNAAALARPPRVPSRTLQAGRDYLAATDLRQLLDTAALHPLHPLVTLAATTGMRQGEILGLSWPDVDLEAATLTVRRAMARTFDGYALAEPKTARSRRSLHLPAKAVTALERQRERQEGEREAAGGDWQDADALVFTDALGRPLKGYEVTHEFHSLLEAAGLPSIPFHGLRHSAATAMLEAGVPLKTVSETLGHGGISITADTYAHITPSMRREAADAMDRALA